MWSTLPKLADKGFIVGFVVPAIVFTLYIVLIFPDFTKIGSLGQIFNQLQSIEKIAYIGALLWAFAILLMLVNDILFKVLEGYYWPTASLKCLKRQKQREFEYLTGEFDRLNAEFKKRGEEFPIPSRRGLHELRQDIVLRFPSDVGLILPTKFGNAIRAFEDYSRSVYGADSIPLWIHLSTVMSKEYQSAVEDFRMQVVCFMNLFYIFILTAALGFIRFTFLGYDQPSIDSKLYLLGISASAILFAWVAYKLSIQSIYSWGSVVKAGFDCYLPELATKLGYELPKDEQRRREFWLAISRRAIYNRKFNPADWIPIETSAAETSPSARAAKPEPGQPMAEQPTAEEAETNAASGNGTGDPASAPEDAA